MATFIVSHPSEGTLRIEYLRNNGSWKDVKAYSSGYEYFYPDESDWSSFKLRFTLNSYINPREYLNCSVNKATGLDTYPIKTHISDKRIIYTHDDNYVWVIGRLAQYRFRSDYKDYFSIRNSYPVLYGATSTEVIPDTGSVDYYQIRLEAPVIPKSIDCDFPYSTNDSYSFYIYPEADITDLIDGFYMTLTYEDTVVTDGGLVGTIFPNRKTETIFIKEGMYLSSVGGPYYYCPEIGPYSIPISTPEDVSFMGRFKKRTYGLGTECEVESNGGPLLYYYLTNDIDMTGWIVEKRQVYNLDGKGFTLKNLTLDNDSEEFLHYQSWMPV